MRLLIVLGEGGHTKDMIMLVDMLSDRYEYGYIVVEDDDVSEAKIRRPGKIYRAIRPRDKTHCLPVDILKTLYCGLQSMRVLLDFKPQSVLSAGPSVSVPVSVLAKLMGIKVIFVENGSRVTTRSLTGRIIYRFADLFFVQWPELTKRYPKAIYAGRLY